MESLFACLNLNILSIFKLLLNFFKKYIKMLETGIKPSII